MKMKGNEFHNKSDNQTNLSFVQQNMLNLRKQLDVVLHKYKKPVGFPKIQRYQYQEIIYNQSFKSPPKPNQNKQHKKLLEHNDKSIQPNQQFKLNKHYLKWPRKRRVVISLENESDNDNLIGDEQSSTVNVSNPSDPTKVKNYLSKSIQNIAIVKKRKGTSLLRGERTIQTYRKQYESGIQTQLKTEQYTSIDGISKHKLLRSKRQQHRNALGKYQLKIRNVIKLWNKKNNQSIKKAEHSQFNTINERKRTNMDEINGMLTGLQKGLVSKKDMISMKKTDKCSMSENNTKQSKQKVQNKNIINSISKQQKLNEEIDLGSFILVIDKEKGERKRKKITPDIFRKNTSRNYSNIIGKNQKQGSKWFKSKKQQQQNTSKYIYTPWEYQQKDYHEQIYSSLIDGEILT